MNHEDTFRVAFDEGKKLTVHFRGHEIKTDEPSDGGGENADPTCFATWLAMFPCCTAYYAREFCRTRDISMESLEVTMTLKRAPNRAIESADIQVKLPADFPEKYRKGIRNAVNACTVKKYLEKPLKLNVNYLE